MHSGLRGQGPEPGWIAEVRLRFLPHPDPFTLTADTQRDSLILISELRHGHLAKMSKLGQAEKAVLHLAPGAGAMAVSKVLAAHAWILEFNSKYSHEKLSWA